MAYLPFLYKIKNQFKNNIMITDSLFYAEQVASLKSKVISDIKHVLGGDSFHTFKDTFYVHYVEGEVATTEECKGVGVNNGELYFVTSFDEDGEGYVHNYDMGSLIDAYERLMEELRSERLDIIKGFVKNWGGTMEFDGTFKITIDDRSSMRNVELGLNIAENCMLTRLSIGDDERLVVGNIFEGSKYTNDENALSFEEVSRILAHIKKTKSVNYQVRVYETFSRIVSVDAVSYSDALKKAQEKVKEEPFTKEDSDGVFAV